MPHRAAAAFAAAFAALAIPGEAFAHTAHGPGGSPFLAGVLHPLGGADHLFAMVAVGLWAAIAAGRALPLYPAAFLAAMLAGAALGAGGLALPAVEPMILASIIVIGALAAAAFRPPLAVALGLIGLFGLAHGHAHGTEGPAAAFAPYMMGFLGATALLHAAGIALGYGAARLQRLAPRMLGGGAALAGLALALQ